LPMPIPPVSWTQPAPVRASSPVSVTPSADPVSPATTKAIVPPRQAQLEVSMSSSASTDTVEPSISSIDAATVGGSEAETPEVTTAMDSLAHQPSVSSIESDPFYHRVTDILRGSPEVVIARLKQLASIYEQQGDYEAATFFSEKVIENQKLLYGEEHPEIVLSLIQLSSLYRESGQLENARVISESTVAMWRSLYASDHPELSASLGNLESLQAALSILKSTADAESFHPDSMPVDEPELQRLSGATAEVATLEELDPVEQVDPIIIDSAGQIAGVEQTDSVEQVEQVTEIDQLAFSSSEDLPGSHVLVEEAAVEALNESPEVAEFTPSPEHVEPPKLTVNAETLEQITPSESTELSVEPSPEIVADEAIN
jgi:hypothetical protein